MDGLGERREDGYALTERLLESHASTHRAQRTSASQTKRTIPPVRILIRNSASDDGKTNNNLRSITTVTVKTNTNDSNTHARPFLPASSQRLSADNIFANALICPFCTTFFGESNDPSALPPSCASPSRSVVLVAASCLYIGARCFCDVAAKGEEEALCAVAAALEDDDDASAGPGRSGMGPRACWLFGFLGRWRGGGVKTAPLGSE